VADVPPAVVTVTSTVPALLAEDVAVICVAESTWNDDAAVDPNVTALDPVNPVPVIVTDVPPSAGPADGDTEVTVDAGT
jgi:hypothetical protein